VRGRPLIRQYEDVPAFSFRSIGGFSPSHRFQVVATMDARLVGYWSFDVMRRGRILDSTFTWVATPWRKSGVATAMWLAGIERWRPKQIRASIGSWQGSLFLAGMVVRLLRDGAATEIAVDTGDSWRESYDRNLRESALRAVRQLRMVRPSDSSLRLVAP
jgi:hypothetical protein